MCMIKKRMFSTQHDFKTGFFYKLLLIVGMVLLAIYLIGRTVQLIDIDSTVLGSILAFAILCIGGGLLAYFISSQFSKLEEIASEIEFGNDTCGDDTKSIK